MYTDNNMNGNYNNNMNNGMNNYNNNNMNLNNQSYNNMNTPPKKPKKGVGIAGIIPYFFIIAILVVVAMLIFPKFFFGDEEGVPTTNTTENPEPQQPVEPTPPPVETSKYKIYNTVSNKRPYAISINNTPVAVKVQEGLNSAYIVYEIPTEGFTSRLMAVFKDVNDMKVGTLRSCRHNFLDYAHENDAILICFGWSHYAQDELNKGGTDFMNGNESKWSSAFWRSNPEKLATEHTAYSNLSTLIDYTTKNNYRLTSDSSQLLNYSAEEINLDGKEGVKTANTVTLPYGSVTTKFNYDAKTKMYTRVVNGTVAKDHRTKEAFTTKNIIVVKMPYNVMPDNYYWNLKNTGSGKGYYITNGKSVPITWKKESRNGKTKYYYSDGSEVQVNDGRTYIELHITDKTVSIG